MPTPLPFLRFTAKLRSQGITTSPWSQYSEPERIAWLAVDAEFEREMAATRANVERLTMARMRADPNYQPIHGPAVTESKPSLPQLNIWSNAEQWYNLYCAEVQRVEGARTCTVWMHLTAGQRAAFHAMSVQALLMVEVAERETAKRIRMDPTSRPLPESNAEEPNAGPYMHANSPHPQWTAEQAMLHLVQRLADAANLTTSQPSSAILASVEATNTASLAVVVAAYNALDDAASAPPLTRELRNSLAKTVNTISEEIRMMHTHAVEVK